MVSEDPKSTFPTFISVIFQVGDDGVKFIQITDVDSKTLDKILRHIYDEDIEDTELDAKLLEAAKLYEVILLALQNLLLSVILAFNVTAISVIVKSLYCEKQYFFSCYSSR